MAIHDVPSSSSSKDFDSSFGDTSSDAKAEDNKSAEQEAKPSEPAAPSEPQRRIFSDEY